MSDEAGREMKGIPQALDLTKAENFFARTNEVDLSRDRPPEKDLQLEPAGWSYNPPEHEDERWHRLEQEGKDRDFERRKQGATHFAFLFLFVVALVYSGLGIALPRAGAEFHKYSEQLANILMGAIAGYFAGKKKGGD